MSTFKDLLKEYCPNGVEHKKLGEVFNLRNGYTPSTKNEAFWKNGNLPWFTMKDLRANGRILSDSIAHITCEGVRGSLFPKDSIILATTATIGEHALITTDFLCNQRFTAFSAKPQYATRLLPMYAFYCFFSVDEWCKKHIAASTFPSISTDMLRDVEIPLPPLEVQEKIADVLDAFAELESELESELENRNKQYGFYRKNLLKNGAPEVPLKDLVAITKGKQLNRELCSKVQTEETPFPVVNGGMKPSGFWNEYNFDKGKITIAEGGASGFVNWQSSPFWAGSGCFVISECNLKKLNEKYLYYFLKEKQYLLQSQGQGAAITHLHASCVLSLEIPLPPLEVQEKIADVLDRFTSLTSSMKAGIPAEISLRRKQMDWYRDAMFKALYSEEEK